MKLSGVGCQEKEMLDTETWHPTHKKKNSGKKSAAKRQILIAISNLLN